MREFWNATYRTHYAYSLGFTLVLACSPAVAVESGHYDIKPQALGSAINAFIAVSQWQVGYSADLVRGKQSPSIAGDYAPIDALKRLLEGSGLQIIEHGAKLVTLEPQPEGRNTPNRVDLTSLLPVTVLGTAIYDATDPYNPDYTLPNASAGTKLETPIMETPLNVQVVSKQVLKDQQAFSFEKALKNVSGVSVQSQSGFSGAKFITLRGFDTANVLRNGFRINNGFSVNWGAGGTREFANIESLEVLKGPAAVLYGQVEPGGMVNIVTKQPLAAPYHSIQQQFGSYDLYRTSVDSTGPVSGDALLYRLNFSYESSHSFRELLDNDNIFIAPVLKWQISGNTEATFELEYIRDKHILDDTFLPASNGQILRLPRSRNLGEALPSSTETFFGGFNIAHKFNNDWSVKYAVNINHTSDDLLFMLPTDFNADTNTLSRIPFEYQALNANYGTNIDLTGHFHTGFLEHKLLIGGEYYRSNFGVSYYLDGNFPDVADFPLEVTHPQHDGRAPLSVLNRTQSLLDNHSTMDQYGAYFQDQIKLPYHVSILGGLRYQNFHFEQQLLDKPAEFANNPVFSQQAVTPRTGVIWQPEAWLSLYGSYAENFGLNLGQGLDNKPLPPTSAQQWEIGLKTEFFGGRLRANLDYYDLTKQNIAVTYPPNPSFNVVAGEVNSNGVELDVQGEIIPGWNTIATYAYQDVAVTKGNEFFEMGKRLSQVPRHIASVWSTYEFLGGSLSGWKIGGGVNVRGRSLDYTNTLENASYATLDLMTSYSFKLGKSKITTQFNVDNVLDKSRYNVSGNLNPFVYGSFISPLTFLGSINLQF